MESVLLSVAKGRKAQRKQTVFVDTLLQSSLTERQVNTDEVTRSSSKPKRRLKALHRGFHRGLKKYFCLFQIMEDCMVFTLAGCVITANCKRQQSKQLQIKSVFTE